VPRDLRPPAAQTFSHGVRGGQSLIKRVCFTFDILHFDEICSVGGRAT
jgi:hypothetical protein